MKSAKNDRRKRRRVRRIWMASIALAGFVLGSAAAVPVLMGRTETPRFSLESARRALDAARESGAPRWAPDSLRQAESALRTSMSDLRRQELEALADSVGGFARHAFQDDPCVLVAFQIRNYFLLYAFKSCDLLLELKCPNGNRTICQPVGSQVDRELQSGERAAGRPIARCMRRKQVGELGIDPIEPRPHVGGEKIRLGRLRERGEKSKVPFADAIARTGLFQALACELADGFEQPIARLSCAHAIDQNDRFVDESSDPA